MRDWLIEVLEMAKDHGLTAEESKDMVAGLMLVHGLVNDEFGVMK